MESCNSYILFSGSYHDPANNLCFVMHRYVYLWLLCIEATEAVLDVPESLLTATVIPFLRSSPVTGSSLGQPLNQRWGGFVALFLLSKLSAESLT